MQRKNKTREVVRSKKPNATSDDLLIADQYDTVKEVAIFSKTEGGKILIERSLKDVVSTIFQVTNSYKTATHAELQGLCASLEANLNLYQVLSQSEKNADAFKRDLEEIMNTTDE